MRAEIYLPYLHLTKQLRTVPVNGENSGPAEEQLIFQEAQIQEHLNWKGGSFYLSISPGFNVREIIHHRKPDSPIIVGLAGRIWKCIGGTQYIFPYGEELI